MTKLASVLPFATGMSTNGVPAVVVLGDTSSTSGLLLVIRTVTPPCAVAPSRAAKPPVIRPPPTSPGRFSKRHARRAHGHRHGWRRLEAAAPSQ